MAFRTAAVFAMLVVLAACKTDLHTELTESEANEIVSALRHSGLRADREMQKNGLVTVRVDDSAFADAVEILRAKGYPRRQYSNLGQVFEAKGFVSSQTEERARFIFAMSEELSRTISEIDGVISARTHVVLPTNDPLSRDTPPSSASVVIRHAEDAAAPELLPQIKMMVANSIEGLDYGNVSVVFIPVKDHPQTALPVLDAPVSQTNGIVWGIVGLGLFAAILVAGWFVADGRRSRGGLTVESVD